MCTGYTQDDVYLSLSWQPRCFIVNMRFVRRLLKARVSRSAGWRRTLLSQAGPAGEQGRFTPNFDLVLEKRAVYQLQEPAYRCSRVTLQLGRTTVGLAEAFVAVDDGSGAAREGSMTLWRHPLTSTKRRLSRTRRTIGVTSKIGPSRVHQSPTWLRLSSSIGGALTAHFCGDTPCAIVLLWRATRR